MPNRLDQKGLSSLIDFLQSLKNDSRWYASEIAATVKGNTVPNVKACKTSLPTRNRVIEGTLMYWPTSSNAKHTHLIEYRPRRVSRRNISRTARNAVTIIVDTGVGEWGR